ncbi:MAG: glycosidase [Candidatus Diapherotrites archaeon]|uniref:Glycosidase n=1 Tax=Candidatus Iainarchaeum sp. TaxID=3101447 RepID=A0A2D6M1U5_9ARCH|nr:glycosidase [Candidatus Diapherotrites archaeon]|tara:strand:- start:4745 stop:5821 length:1077 start_codon:yes stop_codon:yes gene_type:complete
METEKLLLQPKDIKPSVRNWSVQGVLNPAVARLPSKKIVLFARVAERSAQHAKGALHCPVITHKKGFRIGEERISRKDVASVDGNGIRLKNGICRLSTFSHLRKVVLNKNGFDIESIAEKPTFTGTPHEGQYGVEDARITKLGRKYLMTYVSVSKNEGVSTSLAISKNLSQWKRMGIIFREQNKDCVIFPEKIKGKYVALHRPEGFFEFSQPSIWISYSNDLVYWGREKSIIQPRPNSWESLRIGAGAVPLKTREGWLEIYHGVKQDGGNKIYSAGAILLDLKNPEKIIARSPKNKPLFSPSKQYEKIGFVNNVVFPTGAIIDLNKKDLLIYLGAADTSIAVKRMALTEVFNNLEYIK